MKIFVTKEIIFALENYDYYLPKIPAKLDWWKSNLNEHRDNVILEIAEIIRLKNLAELEIRLIIDGQLAGKL
jgi:hypothetical protein